MKERHLAKFARAVSVSALFFTSVKGFNPPFQTSSAEALKYADCSYGEAKEKGHIADAMAIFGAGSFPDENGHSQPNRSQLARMEAAAIAYVRGYASKIILLDGGDEEAIKNSIAFLQSKVKELSDGKMELPPSAIYFSIGDVNTATNAASLKEFVDEMGLEKVASITDGFHAVRAEMLACNYGVNSKMMTVEELGVTYYSRFSLFREDKEYIGIALLRVDKLGKIPTAIKRLTKPSSLP